MAVTTFSCRCLIVPLLLSQMMVGASPGDEAHRLEIHRTRAADLKPLQDWLSGLVPESSRMRLPHDSRAIAVLASPSTHAAITRKIADHENEAVLIDQIDLSQTDINRFLETAQTLRQHVESSDGSLLLKLDRRRNKMTVRGIRLHVDTLKRIAKSEEFAAKRIDPAINQESDDQSSPRHFKDDSDTVTSRDDSDPTRPKFLRLPSGPIRVVPIRELDLLLIRGRN